MPAPNYPGQNIHLELPSIMNNIRLCPANSFWSIVDTAGVVHNLKDLGIQVTAYTGGGMAPIVNQTTPYALIGGSYYQRTTPLPRPLVLICYIDGPNLRGLQLLRKTLISYVAPDTSTQQAAGIKLRYGLTDYCGAVIGTVLEVPVNYVSGLEGNVDNLNQERFPLQFIEYAPPNIKELTTNSNSLSFQNASFHGAGTSVAVRTNLGVWSRPSNTTLVASIYDPSDNAFTASGVIIYKNNVNIQAINGNVNQFLNSPSGLLIVAGNFTTPQNYIMSYNGSTFSAIGATINNGVNGIVYGVDGNLYAVGSFTAPAPGHFAKYNGSAWSALADPGFTPSCIARGLDGNLYIGGALITGKIQKYNPTTNTFSNMSTGMNGTNGVNSIVVGPDGRIYAGGDFTTAGGNTANRVAVWNGTAWQPCGLGLNGEVDELFFDTVGNLLYAVGGFTGISDGSYALPGGIATWNGSFWLPIDIYVNPASVRTRTSTVSQVSRALVTSPDAVSDAGGVTVITNAGTANAVPTFVFTGPGILVTLINYTTGKKIYFNYTLLAGETATLSLDPTALSFTSNFFGNVLNKILPGSDLTTFNLAPGTNSISVLISGTTSGATSATLQYRNTHWSFDAGVS